ncbi:hypothetical protein EYB26_004802 [Talaromyces marneffei]|uniref:uncharacterized protein n=1 Tax=Talaromyces marneffei TaxID=37727 RepID=UPI0012A9175E|nr:uncharacterized protein EYB26_004802 [Talaromyces marneffei]QGA17132.1 hypothetical protein EYB26_004802 [Talaromyces marneffei]
MSLKFSIDETDPFLKKVEGRYSDWKAFNILCQFLLQDDLSVRQAVSLLHNILPTKKEENLGGQPGMLVCVLLDIARQIPYSHPAQIQLVRLVGELRKSDRLTFHAIDYDQGYSFYTSMPDLGMTLREWSPWTMGFDEVAHGVNMAAFAARLSASGIINGISFAIWDMRDNLEEDDESDLEHYSEYISCAAMWILCSGQWFFTEMVYVQRSPADLAEVGPSWRTGSLYKGPILGLERWKFWQKAFIAAAESVHANEECKTLSLKSANIMQALAENVTW